MVLFESYEESDRFGLAVWQFDGTAWRLFSNQSVKGGVPVPPSVPGEFVGELRSTPSAPADDNKK